MKMILNIYKNEELVNTITAEDRETVFKNIAQALFTKEQKRATKTTIGYYCNNLKITQVFDKSKTMIENTTYTYKYIFEDVEL